MATSKQKRRQKARRFPDAIYKTRIKDFPSTNMFMEGPAFSKADEETWQERAVPVREEVQQRAGKRSA